MELGEIFTKAWRITWRNKVLWFFGLLASCSAAGGGGGGGSGNYNTGSGENFGNKFNNLPPQLEEFGRLVERSVQDGTIWIIFALFILAVIAISLLAALIMFILGTIGRIGVARGAWMADEEEQKLHFRDLWAEVPVYFWRVVLFSILIWFIGIAAGIILLLPTLLITIITCGCGLILLIPVLIVFGWLVKGFLEFSVAAITGENLRVFEAVERAWGIIRHNFWNFLLFSVIISIGSGIASLIIGLPVILVVIPFVAGLIFGGEIALITGGIASGILLLIYIPIALWLTGVLYAYIGTAWVLTFRRLAGKPQGPGVE